MSDPRETGRPERLAQQPARSYELPGGPFAPNLGEIEVAIMAEIKRGGPNDGNRR